MKQSKLIAAIAMTGLAATTIGCSRKGDSPKPVAAAQTFQHKSEECPGVGMYVQAGEDGQIGPRRVNIVKSGDVFGIAEYKMENLSWKQDMGQTFQADAKEERLDDGAVRLAKCSEGSIFVTYSNENNKSAVINVRYEPIEGGKSLRVTTTDLTKSSDQTSVVNFVRYTNPASLSGEDGTEAAPAPAPEADPADTAAPQAPASAAPAAPAHAAPKPAAPAADPVVVPEEGLSVPAPAAPAAPAHTAPADTDGSDNL